MQTPAVVSIVMMLGRKEERCGLFIFADDVSSLRDKACQ